MNCIFKYKWNIFSKDISKISSSSSGLWEYKPWVEEFSCCEHNIVVVTTYTTTKETWTRSKGINIVKSKHHMTTSKTAVLLLQSVAVMSTMIDYNQSNKTNTLIIHFELLYTLLSELNCELHYQLHYKVHNELHYTMKYNVIYTIDY